MDNQEKARESILVISLAVIQQQCSPTEGVIRLRNLLEHFPKVLMDPNLKILNSFYEDVQYLDTHEAYNKLKISERLKQDNKRYKAEDTYEKEFIEACQYLRNYFNKNFH